MNKPTLILDEFLNQIAIEHVPVKNDDSSFLLIFDGVPIIFSARYLDGYEPREEISEDDKLDMLDDSVNEGVDEEVSETDDDQ